MIQIKNMTAAHVPQIAQIEKLCFSDPWSASSVATELENSYSLWLVALDGDTVAGYVGSQSVLDGADMMNIAVHPDYRRQGIARELVTGLINALAEKGVKSLALEVRQSNAPAIALYEQLGFIQVGLRTNYYRNPKENALILRKEWSL